MIIVSQDKYNILNFDKTVNIGVEEITTLADIVRISAITEDDRIVLGTYKNEERAKEVLQEIIGVYTSTNIFKYSNSENTKYDIVDEMKDYDKQPFVYEMPEE